MYLVYLLRRDLRLSDNPVFHALQNHPRYTHVLPLYIFPPSQIEVSGLVQSRIGAKSPYPEARSRIGKFWRCGPHRAKFLAEGLWDLKSELEALGSGLMMRVGHMDEVVRGLLEGGFGKKVAGVWMTMDWASEELEQMRDVRAIVDKAGKGNVEWKVWDGEEMLIHDNDLPMKPDNLPDTFTSFRKRLGPLDRSVRPPLPRPASLPPLPPSTPPQPHPFKIPDSLDGLIDALQRPLAASDLASTIPPPIDAKSAHPFIGGETQAHMRVEHLLLSGAMSTYKDTRNGLLGADFSTKLSGYLSHGFITARQVHAWMSAFEDAAADQVPREWRSLVECPGYGQGENKGTAAVRFELLWRDYMRLCMRKYGDSLFSLYGFRGQQARSTNELPHRKGKAPGGVHPSWKSFESARAEFKRFQSGTTGTGLIDASMRELYLTGYTSNRARQNCASFLAKWLGIDWRVGAEWYESMLVDYDVANNWGNWQYVAGVGNDPRGAGADGEAGGRRFNPVKQGWDYDPRAEYVRTWVAEMSDVGHEGDLGSIEVALAGWKVHEVLARRAGQLGSVSGRSKEAIERLRGLEWVERPLIKIDYKKRIGRNSEETTGAVAYRRERPAY
ncbi:hypothetical protein D9615_008938 [Tricholomella constricta]|uniref:Cryptochrome DASH n=1 Tax=Tricholomella constricta TaxID=117010 RepID=A0A8H5H0R4_9AGAR|nr:hypothetical protein D9615_008938 [Tricholomella constricta]